MKYLGAIVGVGVGLLIAPLFLLPAKKVVETADNMEFDLKKINKSILKKSGASSVEFYRIKNAQFDCLVLVNNSAGGGMMALNMECAK